MIGIMEYMDMCGLDLIQAVHSYLLQDLDVSAGPSPLVRQKVKDGGARDKKAARAFMTGLYRTPKGLWEAQPNLLEI